MPSPHPLMDAPFPQPTPSHAGPGTPEAAISQELLGALGRVVRGLSALFWGLPIALVVCVQTASGDWLRPMGVVPPLLATSLLVYGLGQLSSFRKSERVWQRALDRARLFALAQTGLAPFLFWWNRMPDEPFFKTAIAMMAGCGLVFLFQLNPMLRRLAAMLPDETLRQETRAFTALNRGLLLAGLGTAVLLHLLARYGLLPLDLLPANLWRHAAGMWILLFLVLMPVAMTMAMLWKIKEVILSSVFCTGPQH